MRVTLCSKNPRQIAEWQRYFVKYSDVISIRNLDFTECQGNALVIAGNSYGFVPEPYSSYFGPGLQNYLQTKIKENPMRELLVGTSLNYHTTDKFYPVVIWAPVSRVPMNVNNTANLYLAFKSSLVTATEMGLKTIVWGGVDTVTEYSETDISIQMFQAFKDLTDKFPRSYNNIREAILDNRELISLNNLKRR